MCKFDHLTFAAGVTLRVNAILLRIDYKSEEFQPLIWQSTFGGNTFFKYFPPQHEAHHYEEKVACKTAIGVGLLLMGRAVRSHVDNSKTDLSGIILRSVSEEHDRGA